MWIVLADKKPEEGQPILLWQPGVMRFGVWKRGHLEYSLISSEDEQSVACFTHWMALPEVPK